MDRRPGTALARTFPDGWVYEPTSPCAGDNPINAVYNDVPCDHPGLFPAGSTVNPGGDALALGLQYSLGLSVDYYLLVDLTAFGPLVDAIGGVGLKICDNRVTAATLPPDNAAPSRQLSPTREAGPLLC